jgi:hypothetical protein
MRDEEEHGRTRTDTDPGLGLKELPPGFELDPMPAVGGQAGRKELPPGFELDPMPAAGGQAGL